MRYVEPVYRPPSEAQSLIVQATIGCPWNRCDFCYLYKEKKFKIRPVKDILQDIEGAGKLYRDAVRSVFLADGNSIVLKTPDLVEILRALRRNFPNLERVTSYGGARIIPRTKTPEELNLLRAEGLSRVHMGLESGSDAVLAAVNKGSTAGEAIRAARMIKDAGIELSEYVVLGLGGKSLSREHAEGTAKTLSEIAPDFIRFRTLLIRPDMPLWKRYESGEFVPLTRLETLKETKMIVQGLECATLLLSDHVTNIADINGRLPQDKKKILARLDEAINEENAAPDDREWAVDASGTRGL